MNVMAPKGITSYFSVSVTTLDYNLMALTQEKSAWSPLPYRTFYPGNVAKANNETRLLLVVRKKQTICFD